jgi:hypothetical protein
LNVTNGSWESFPANLSYQYSWFRCETAQTSSSETTPEGCTQITLNASSNSYELVEADVGKHVVARVTANLSPLVAGVDSSTDAFSTSQGVIVEAQAQSFNSGPVLSGTNFLRLSIQ